MLDSSGSEGERSCPSLMGSCVVGSMLRCAQVGASRSTVLTRSMRSSLLVIPAPSESSSPTSSSPFSPATSPAHEPRHRLRGASRHAGLADLVLVAAVVVHRAGTRALRAELLELPRHRSCRSAIAPDLQGSVQAPSTSGCPRVACLSPTRASRRWRSRRDSPTTQILQIVALRQLAPRTDPREHLDPLSQPVERRPGQRQLAVRAQLRGLPHDHRLG